MRGEIRGDTSGPMQIGPTHGNTFYTKAPTTTSTGKQLNLDDRQRKRQKETDQRQRVRDKWRERKRHVI